jgi:hypothetical protein
MNKKSCIASAKGKVCKLSRLFPARFIEPQHTKFFWRNTMKNRISGPLSGLGVFGLFALGASLVPGAQTAAFAQTAPDGSVSVLRTPLEGDETTQPLDPKDYPQGILFPYSLLDAAYAGNIDRSGNVNYSALKDNKSLQLFLKAIQYADLSAFPVFDVYSTDEKTGRQTKVSKDRTAELVFWINAYNALRLNAIAQAYPIKSIDEIKDFDTAEKYNVAGKLYSFKQLREKIASFGDPRALFALPTGTAGGFLPSPTAVRVSEYDARMNAAVSVFVNDPRNVRLNRIQNRVTLNPAFEEVDEILMPAGKKRKGDGIRRALSGYTDRRANRSYFTTNEYRIEYGTANRGINDMSNNANMAPMEEKK